MPPPKTLVRSVHLALIAAAHASLVLAATPPAPAPASVASPVLAAMDPKADPCVDFYRYACGGWLDSEKIPGDRSTWVRSFSVITERNREIVRELLEQAAADPGGDPDRQRVGDFFAACMDEAKIEAAGKTPLQPLWADVATVKDPASLLAAAGRLQRVGANALLAFGALPDFKHPETDIAIMVQGGLGMPDRDYYVSEDPKKRELLAGYERHVARLLALAGEPEDVAARHAKAIVAFETELAKASRPAAEMRVVEKLYNKLDAPGLAKLTPGLDWKAFFTGLGHPDVAQINVATPEFFQALERLAAATPADTLQAYLRWHLVHALAPALSKDFVDADFEFYQRALAGQQEIQPRWKRCVDATEGALGEAVGKLYVAKQFSGDSKPKALEMIHDIETAFGEALPRLEWMDETTRARAIEKRDAIGNKIGYPDAWRDYSKMAVSRRSHLDNTLAATSFEFDRQARKIGKPVDRKEWGMTPQQVNAYYNPLLNEIAFPAGILQPPFFHADFPAAMNYGGIGTVVGHELTHGFDDQGRKFDAKGAMREWWEPQVSQRYDERAACVDRQYSGYEIEPGINVNGKLTLGENIADVGGLRESWAAYKAWEARHGASPTVGDLTPDQLFFVAHGQVWCALMKPEVARLRVTIDPHSPPRFRVVGPVANHPAFAKTFQCAAGTPMNPAAKCEVW